MKHSLYILLILSLFSCNKNEKISPFNSIELNLNWEFSKMGDKEWYPATVPGVIHLDLLNNNLINDPYWENNEEKQRWIEEENWVYKTHFQLDDHFLRNDKIELQFDGLDTYADIYVNGEMVLQATNMFRKWNIDVKNFVKEGDNELKIIFLSPILHNKQRVENYPFLLPSGNESKDVDTKVSSFTRKAAYHFGWDWGPRFVTSGIWRKVALNSWNKARLLNVYTTTLHLNSDYAEMLTKIEIEVLKAGVYQFIIDGKKHLENLNKGENEIEYLFEIDDPQLWWCNGAGDAHLYDQKIELAYEDRQIDSKEIRYGIRTIELVNEKDSIGTSFYFKLNGKAIFIQGANYIPQDLFLPRVQEKQYKKLIKDVRDANMNMLRVWGGGIYENDLFYDLCDENGILVWQDFMFAGSLYPDNAKFIENVKQEVIDNIKRLRQHPSIALWCGNNEIEVAWKNWGWQQQYNYSPEDSTRLWSSYTALFHDLIPELITKYDGQRSYTPTTPLSNWGSAPNFNHSSMHYWGVWHGREAFENFESNVGRFMVEYGFQSFPEMGSLKKVMSDSSLYLASSAMNKRQKSYIGNDLILNHINQYFKAPKSFDEFVTLSQNTQAKGLQMAIKAHKSNQPHCMGTLFWQLNDCWPGPSWSIIDYYGKHKTAYEVVKKEFSTQP